MAVSEISNASWSSYFQTAGKIGAIGGAVTSVTCAVLGQDYTYPCAIAALGACAWFSIWLNQSAPQDTLSPKTEGKTVKKLINDQVDKLIDATGETFKKQVNGSTDKFVDVSINAGKTASIAYLPPGVGSLAGASLDSTSGSIKGLSAKSFDVSIDSSTGLSKRSAARSFDSSSEKTGDRKSVV